ncbi:MAG: indolepyruvate ferredoxin oxidoreductase family protein [Gammaproteobacteria bacterium]|nr:indolepyruvate ferredoxin oxidoreductase family protein [Gammaproteobacteria bacterium]
MALRKLESLDNRYMADAGEVYLTGTQALVRLMLTQAQRDAQAGLDTAGFVSGYRGSPLGGLDQQFWRAAKHLQAANIRFQPGVNEDLAATAVWGTQQVGLFPGARHDGVFGMWYGKGPGVDRSGDVFKHANAAGTARHGGVLAVAGDDHACKSSTLAHQSEHAFIDAMIPILNPAGVQEVLDLGLYGYAMSRFSGCWVALKAISETADSAAVVDVDPARVRIALPEDFAMPPSGLSIRWPDPPLAQEARLHRHKVYAALAFARANRLDRIALDCERPRLGIVATGKAWLDVRQALDDLHIDDNMARHIGLRLYKVAMSWPLERDGVRAFAHGLEEVLVVEEKRAIIENQLKEQLYNWHEDARPRVVGKFDEQGQVLLPSTGELTPAGIARAIAARIQRFHDSASIQARLGFLQQKEASLADSPELLARTPHFCSGCPHNTSTKVPAGSRAIGGIGCHYMATWMDRSTETFSQMGGEGATWIGQAPFTETTHVFQNLGDGTYFHSGLLAIRAAVSAGVNITYKLLFNDAVAMTGGQPVDGQLTVPMLVRQVQAEGVARVLVVSDEPERYAGAGAVDVPVHHRRELPGLQEALRLETGVSVLVYDQTCAAEKRRRRKRGLLVDPPKRAYINKAVCEGCGDCGAVSNCLSIVPVETELGRKRAINQNSCNKDFSCVEGFCPSFVTVHGGALRKAERTDAPMPDIELPEPVLPTLSRPWNIVIAGIGGTGVVTVSNLLGMAAHLEHHGATVLDQTGLAQKFGAVTSHVRIAAKPADIHAVRVAAGSTDLLLGCDIAVAAGDEVLGKLDATRSAAVINAHEDMPAAFVRERDLGFPGSGLRRRILGQAKDGAVDFIDATRLATRLLGDSMAANLLLVGFAYQQGRLPISADALAQAVRLNGVAVEMNLAALRWGRIVAVDPAAVERLITGPTEGDSEAAPDDDAEAVIRHRSDLLWAYQDQRYADRYLDRLGRVADAETRISGHTGELTLAVARNLARLMAYKDEYEVARLFTSPAFMRELRGEFTGDVRLEFHLAPPLLSRIDPATGRPRKRAFGAWMMAVFRVLAPLRRLRGSVFDLFGYSAERRAERQLVEDYEHRVDRVLAHVDKHNLALAVALLRLPEGIRGFGPVKAEAMDVVATRTTEIENKFFATADHPGDIERSVA